MASKRDDTYTPHGETVSEPKRPSRSGGGESAPLLEAVGLRTMFHTRNGVIRAVDGVSLTVASGETVGIVGESGCGKTVLCQSIMGLVPSPPARISYERLMFNGAALTPENERAMRGVRGNAISMIFQDPMTSLNPYMRIGAQLVEPLVIHSGLRRKNAAIRAAEALRSVGIAQPERRVKQYPHEFSGGMRQRVCIAMALITHPRLLLADEPTTALDVTVQAQILSLLKKLQSVHGIAVVFVTHDFGVVAGLCNRVMVMYAGRVVESGSTHKVFNSPKHPYTRALLRSLPGRAQPGKALEVIGGQPPELSAKQSGCAFAARCEFAQAVCRAEEMELKCISPGHATACIRVEQGEIGTWDAP